jgi:hypothetical protein
LHFKTYDDDKLRSNHGGWPNLKTKEAFMNRPKVLKLFTVLSIFLCILAVQNVAYANYADTAYNYYFSGSNTQGTPGRTKDTNSMSYIRVDRMDPNSVRFYIDGSYSLWSGYVNETRNDHATISHTGHFNIHNYVYEAGMRYARMTAWGNDGNGVVKGAWSPDSRGGYTEVN